MQYYLAPMEEITTYIYRNAVTEMFGAPDRCFAPFIAPTEKILVKKRERRDISRDNNRTAELVPQILTRNADGFCKVTNYLYEEGYREVNLNLGCPSGTVTAKGKGSGFLKTPELLDSFLKEVFAEVEETYNGNMRISVKTRVGYESVDEFPAIWSVLRAHPFSEIILHPRVRQDFYNGACHMETVRYALSQDASLPIVYNGDIRSVSDVEALQRDYPQITRVMIGRGMVRNPGLIRQLRTGTVLKKDELGIFCGRIYEEYAQLYQDERNAMHKMKELWTYMADCFADASKPLKRILKSKKPIEYREAVQQLFQCDFCVE